MMPLRRLSLRLRQACGSRRSRRAGGGIVGWRGEQIEEIKLTQEGDWQKWRRQESDILGETIAFAARVFGTTEKEVEGSRSHGAALLAQSIECARAIRVCLDRELPSPAFALARAQYEGALRGHIIINEIELEELNVFLGHIRSWVKDTTTRAGPPKIEIKKKKWRIVKLETRSGWRPIRHWVANLFVEWIGSNSGNMGLLYDLAHSGMTHALQMRNEGGNIEPNYSDKTQTFLLYFSDRVVMFSIMIWPGAEEMYRCEIEERMERNTQLRRPWADFIPA